MEQFKLNNFRNENPSGVLNYLTLNIHDSQWVIDYCLQLLSYHKELSAPQGLFKYFQNTLPNSINVNENNLMFELSNLLNSIGIENDSIVYIIWDFNMLVDQFINEQLLKSWNYIWYDVSDEAVFLVYPGHQKVIMISEHGYIKTN